MINIDWSEAPEGFPIWCQDLFEREGYKTSGWHLEEADRYIDPNGRFWLKCSEGRSFVAYTRPIPWSGEGLPPVGTVCEYRRVGTWVKVEVFAIKPNGNGSSSALFTHEDGTWQACAHPSGFRPLRTPEQIAAEEREDAVVGMLNILGGDFPEVPFNALARLYDAGYRKADGGAA